MDYLLTPPNNQPFQVSINEIPDEVQLFMSSLLFFLGLLLDGFRVSFVTKFNFSSTKVDRHKYLRFKWYILSDFRFG